MLGLGKKKKEEFEDEEKPIRKKSSSRKVDEDLKDLNPKNKNKRKEPPKPWGKAERLLVISIVFGSALMAGILGLASRSWKLPGLPRLFSSELAIEKTYVIEADETEDILTSQVKSFYSEKTKSLTGVYGFYVGRLYQDNSYGELEDEQFPSARLMRLPLMIVLYMEGEEGNISLTQSEELITRLNDPNDVDAYNQSLSLIGPDRFQELVKEIGMSKTSVYNDLTTPADIGKLFRKLWEGRLLNTTNTSKVFKSISNSGGYLSSQIGEDVNVAQVYGNQDHVINNAGIIFSRSQPIVIVVMSKGVVDSEATSIIPQLVGFIYDSEK